MAKSAKKKAPARKAAKEVKALEVHDTAAAVKGATSFQAPLNRGTPLIEMREISIAFALL